MTGSRLLIDPHNFLRRKNDRFERDVIEEIASLRAAVDMQGKRIAQLQAELDVLFAARNPHEPLRTRMLPRRPSHPGNGGSQR